MYKYVCCIWKIVKIDLMGKFIMARHDDTEHGIALYPSLFFGSM